MLDSFLKYRSRRLGAALAIGASLVILAGCGQGKLEACRFLEIEEAEADIEIGDIDIERAEVEMVCDGQIVDVTWPEFRRKLGIDPGAFRGDVDALGRVVACGMYERADDDRVWCRTSDSDEPIALKFSLDD